MYWLPKGQLVTEKEVQKRLCHLGEHGPTPFAFTFEQPFTARQSYAFVPANDQASAWAHCGKPRYCGIFKLEMETLDLPAQRKFYTTVLGFQETIVTDDSLRLRVGGSELIFRPGPTGELPCYHFAFNISSNKAPQAREWLLARGVPLLKDGDGDLFHSEEWNAHMMYFSDADGNIVEFIARHTLPDYSSGSFGADDVLGISEMGIVVPDVLPFADECMRASGLTSYVEDPQPRFASLGDEHGLLICVPERRPW